MYAQGWYMLAERIIRSCPNNLEAVNPDKLELIEAEQWREKGRVDCSRCPVARYLGEGCPEIKSGKLVKGKNKACGLRKRKTSKKVVVK